MLSSIEIPTVESSILLKLIFCERAAWIIWSEDFPTAEAFTLIVSKNGSGGIWKGFNLNVTYKGETFKKRGLMELFPPKVN